MYIACTKRVPTCTNVLTALVWFGRKFKNHCLWIRVVGTHFNQDNELKTTKCSCWCDWAMFSILVNASVKGLNKFRSPGLAENARITDFAIDRMQPHATDHAHWYGLSLVCVLMYSSDCPTVWISYNTPHIGTASHQCVFSCVLQTVRMCEFLTTHRPLVRFLTSVCYHPVCVPLCTLLACENLLSHASHWYGFSPVCVLRCTDT